MKLLNADDGIFNGNNDDGDNFDFIIILFVFTPVCFVLFCSLFFLYAFCGFVRIASLRFRLMLMLAVPFVLIMHTTYVRRLCSPVYKYICFRFARSLASLSLLCFVSIFCLFTIFVP